MTVQFGIGLAFREVQTCVKFHCPRSTVILLPEEKGMESTSPSDRKPEKSPAKIKLKEVSLFAILTRYISSNFSPEFLSLCEYSS